MKCTFVIGQYVVCTAERFTKSAPLRERPPERGQVCKIVNMRAGPNAGDRCPSGVWLELKGYETAMYCSSEFRPLQQRPLQTDINVFRKLLTPDRERVE